MDSKPKTIETYFRAIKQFIKYLQNNWIKQPCRMDVVLAFRDYLKTFCKPSTIQIYIIAIRLFFKWTASEA
ncbi:MAG: phage integrase N-terminal SAM-like domain-containing protein [Endomicrobium sp.]|nr:phage integrase N-terminal SAM-like domain-containing protein [Endomicrobium sp.]